MTQDPRPTPLQDPREALKDLIAAWDEWEAKVLLDDNAWSSEYGFQVTGKYYDQYIELQDKRTAARALYETWGWREIESAPKDGTEILAYSEYGCTGTMLVRHIALCDFLTDAESEEYFRQGGSEEAYYEADWFAADFLQGSRLSPDCYPTHWMPLPPPPPGSAE